mmetsp:Transcript_11366/g.20073  ORF Transcript_11366/g.20073 Transcript_11366/m.20073 type:complete len:354 (-) Transcript_11366:43-1104(-)|eukprot:CAMPEP_0184527822 /NCGR_PEP_ID=MMETSP0198_2-20121128/11440_1 /TAXON_ID=1112570 /ORGANISM="Thraustochytrium sp., Strain LLF1b" /LENGTH=353 /DNA_ID=CAMNT_0026919581 /DNA_START=124 /DNA_END=1185 /DNA_ORIENTATION=+
MSSGSSSDGALAQAILKHVKAETGSDAAVTTLASALGVDVDENLIAGQPSLAEVWKAGIDSLGVTPAAPAAEKAEERDPVEDSPKFVKYLQVVTEKGYFKDIEEGSDAYKQRYAKLLSKFKEKLSDAAPAAGGDREAVAAADKFKEEGNKFLLSKKYEEAAEKYTQAIEANATGVNSHIYYCNRAAAYMHLGRLDDALEDCSVSSTLKPDYAKAHARAAQVNLKLDRKDDARASAERALEIEPGNAIAVTALREAGGANAVGAAGGMPDMSGLGNMAGMADMMKAMGGAGGPGGAGGMPDIGSLLSNPGMMQAAQQMMQSNPQMMEMAQKMMQDPNAMQNMMNMMGGMGGMPK